MNILSDIWDEIWDEIYGLYMDYQPLRWDRLPAMTSLQTWDPRCTETGNA